MFKERNIWLFANTKWFINRFKFELIKNLSSKNKIYCFYLREGPPINLEKFNFLTKKNVFFYKLDFKIIFQLIFERKLFNLNKYSESFKKPNLLIFFTFTPIVFSFILLKKYRKISVYVLEGLGRIFSSKLLTFRFLKRLVLILYKLNFKNCKRLVTLNYSDALFLSENKIASISKISIIPGTGIDTKKLKDEFSEFERKTNYIDYISRLLVDKGYLKFIYTRLCFIKLEPKLAQKYLFRIIAPQSDINTLSKREVDFLEQNGIVLMPYKSKVSEYYSESKIIIYPSFYGEGLSRLVLEVSYLGIPLLVNRNRGIEEILPSSYKYYIDSMNPLLITNQLIQIIKDEEYFKIITPSQRKKIEISYSSKVSLDAFLKIINS